MTGKPQHPHLPHQWGRIGAQPLCLRVRRGYSADMTGGSTTILEKVRRLIERLAPEPVCDDCIAKKLELPQISQANLAARELAGTHGFERRSDTCALCGTARTVTRHVAR